MLRLACHGRPVENAKFSHDSRARASSATHVKDLGAIVNLTKTAKLRLGLLPTLCRARSASNHSGTTGIRTIRAKSAISIRNQQQSAIDARSRCGPPRRDASTKEVVTLAYAKCEIVEPVKWSSHDPSSKDNRPSSMERRHMKHTKLPPKPGKLNDKPGGNAGHWSETYLSRSNMPRPHIVAGMDVSQGLQKCHPERYYAKEHSTACGTNQERTEGRAVSTKPDTTNEGNWDKFTQTEPGPALLQRELPRHSVYHYIQSSSPSNRSNRNTTSSSNRHITLPCKTVNSTATNSRYSMEMSGCRSRVVKMACNMNKTLNNFDTTERFLPATPHAKRRARSCDSSSGPDCATKSTTMGLCPNRRSVEAIGIHNKTGEKLINIKSHVVRMSHNTEVHQLEDGLSADCRIGHINEKMRLEDSMIKKAEDNVTSASHVNTYGDIMAEVRKQDAESPQQVMTLSLSKLECDNALDAAKLSKTAKHVSSKRLPTVMTMHENIISVEQPVEDNHVINDDCKNALKSHLKQNHELTNGTSQAETSYNVVYPSVIQNCTTINDTDKSMRSERMDDTEKPSDIKTKQYISRTKLNEDKELTPDQKNIYTNIQHGSSTTVTDYLSNTSKDDRVNELALDDIDDNVHVDLPTYSSEFIEDGRQSRIGYHLIDSDDNKVLEDSYLSDTSSSSESSTKNKHNPHRKTNIGKPTLRKNRIPISRGIKSRTNQKTTSEKKSVPVLATAAVTDYLDPYDSDVSSDFDEICDLEEDTGLTIKHVTEHPVDSEHLDEKGGQCSGHRTRPEDYNNKISYISDSSGKKGKHTLMMEYSQVCHSWKKTLRYLKDPTSGGMLIPVDEYFIKKYKKNTSTKKYQNRHNFAIILKESCAAKHPQTNPTGRELIQAKRRYGFSIEPTDFVRRLSCENARYLSGKVRIRRYCALE